MSGPETLSVHRTGFTLLSEPDSPQCGSHKVNIIFVHGLRGHPQATWEDSRTVNSQERAAAPNRRRAFKPLFTRFRAKYTVLARNEDDDSNNGSSSIEPSVFWPRDYLTEDIPEARVWTYGYNADVVRGMFQADNQNSVSQHGQDLATHFKRDIENEGFQGPTIFVAHSLGGIIVKDIKHLSVTNEVGHLSYLAFQDSNKRIVKTLEVNSEVLDNIQDEFLQIVHDAGIKVHSFQEARGISGVKGLHEKVVSDFSSKVGLPEQFETVERIDANHMQMARCNDKKDQQYRVICKVLTQFIRTGLPQGDEAGVQGLTPAVSMEMDRAAASGHTRALLSNRASRPYYIPLPRNRHFTGRDAVLDRLQERLFIRKECQKLAVVGLGGVGKTQVALKFAYWVKDNQPEYSVFWVPALSNGSFDQAYAEIARRLEIRIDKGDDPKQSLQRHLSSEAAGKWLLIVDNADDTELIFGSSEKPGGLHEYLPESENGITLFTTRSRKVAVSAAGCDVFGLQEMDEPEATSFLEKTLVQKQLLQDEATTRRLLQDLTYLPLAITQAVAYLNCNQTPIQNYLELLRGTEEDMVRLMSRDFRDSTRYSGSQNAVASTWLVSFDQVWKFDSAAAELLSFMSCIEPKAIPRSLLPNLRSNEEMENAIGTLCSYAFLTRREEGDMFDMHSLVHVATRAWIQRYGRLQEVAINALHHFAAIFPSNDPANREVWRKYLPHALRVFEESKECQTEERYHLSGKAGRCLYNDRRFGDAVKYLEEVFKWKRASFSEEDASRLSSEHWLARAYLDDRRIKDAIEIFEHVVAIEKKTLAEEDQSRLASEHELARAYLNDRRIKDAMEILEHVVAIRKKTLA
ncbi:hypothetical protein DL768_009806 [Monosporascus sp. mg162]|nr:hypothetical protein DL768_009806 [Monosporascus sp. mg162]